MMGLGVFQTLINLPTDLSCAVIGNWLSLVSLCRLDSALCEKSKRLAFLMLIQSIECIGTFGTWYWDQLNWLNRRSVRTKDFYMGRNMSCELMEAYLQRFGRHVHSFHLFPLSDGKFLHLAARYCYNLLRFQSYSRSCNVDHCSEVLRKNPNLVELTLGCKVDEMPSLPRLKFLDLYGPMHDDTSCIMLVKVTKQLEYLSLKKSGVTSLGMIAAAQFFPNLKYFESNNVLDLDHVLVGVTKVCVNIQHLDLSECKNLTDVGIMAVARNVTGLRSIHFTYSHLVTNASLHQLAEHQHRTLEQFSLIETIDEEFVEPPSAADNKKTFNAVAVSHFRNKCPKLRMFDWMRLEDWPDASTGEIVKHMCSADRVTTLILFKVNDTILASIAASCKQLEVLSMIFCDTVHMCTDAMLIKVVEGCPSLRSMDVHPLQAKRLQMLVPQHIQIHSSNNTLYSYSLLNMYRKDHKLDGYP